MLLCCNVVDNTMLSVKFEFECKSGPRSRYSKRLSRILGNPNFGPHSDPFGGFDANLPRAGTVVMGNNDTIGERTAGWRMVGEEAHLPFVEVPLIRTGEPQVGL